MIYKMIKIAILMILFTALAFAGDPHNLRQMVENWPAGYDTTGKQWYVYDISNPQNDVLTEISIGSSMSYSSSTNRARWTVNTGNFPTPWVAGDSIIAFGFWDSTYAADPSTYNDNPNHTVFYWLFSDTLRGDVATQDFTPADTLRPLPKPIVSQTGPGGDATDTIWVKIPNPMETRRGDQTTYDILGYWVWADSSGIGTPNALNAPSAIEFEYIPVQGGIDDTTVFWQLESQKFTALTTWTTYFAYKLVARPDTTSGESPGSSGYSSSYFSQNSDPIDIYHTATGIEENLDLHTGQLKLDVYPNPFTEKVNITYNIGQCPRDLEFEIYDVTGKLVKQFNHSTIQLFNQVTWSGIDASGKKLSSGVYFVQARSDGVTLTKKVILQR